MTLTTYFLLCSGLLPADGSLRGVVRDAQTGEPLARVEAQLAGEGRQELTDANGAFAFEGLSAGEHLLKAATVGYRVSQTRVTVGEGQTVEVEFALTPDAVERRDRIEVRADPFELTRAGGRRPLRSPEARRNSFRRCWRTIRCGRRRACRA